MVEPICERFLLRPKLATIRDYVVEVRHPITTSRDSQSADREYSLPRGFLLHRVHWWRFSQDPKILRDNIRRIICAAEHCESSIIAAIVHRYSGYRTKKYKMVIRDPVRRTLTDLSSGRA